MTRPTVTLIFMLAVSATFADHADVVNTTLGLIQGLRETCLWTDVDVYYGIPFAKPPVGDLRFKRPEPAEPWTEVKATVTKPNACFQTIDTAFDRFPGVDMWNPNTPLSEDCLYLNVWVPRGSESPNTTMVWIYGGGFHSGSSALDVYDASKLAVTQNVIVASMNYRVGPLGFLYVGTADAPGNQGLLDQSLALKWIHDNVARFGGRSDSITIFGESAGAISVGLHLLSPVSRDHFTRAIMQSWAPTIERAFMSGPRAVHRARKLAKLSDCPPGPTSAMMQCLREASAETLTNAQWLVPEDGYYMEMPMTPVVDDYFLLDDPWTLLARGEVKDTELLTGVNTNEGSFFVVYAFPQLYPEDFNISEAEFENLVYVLSFKDQARSKALIHEYVDSEVPALRDPLRDVANDISGDDSICPTLEFARGLNSLGGRRQDVYLYHFHHRLSNNEWPEWMGVMHGYEIEAVFGLTLNASYTQDEQDLADRMMAYWARFAHTGNPNDPNDVIWPKLTSYESQYLKLTGEGDSVGQGMRRQQCTFRDSILPMVTDCPEA